ncbi:MAG: tetratricopeptide repeat protein [Bacteroidales bacterium]
MRISKNSFRFQALLVVCLTFLPVLTVGVVNYVVDPLQIYRKQQWVEPRFWSNQRSQNAGKIRSYLAQDGYDSIILGNSVAGNFRPSRVAEVMGWKKTMKLTIDGGQASEQSYMLDQALKTGTIKSVFWCIRAANFIDKESEKWHSTEKIPFYLYTENFLDDYEYLLSLDTLKFSYENIRKKNNWSLNLDFLNYWQSKKHISEQIEYNSQKVKSKLQNAKTVCISDLQERKYYPLIDNNILKFANMYKDTRFIIVFAPQTRQSVAASGVQRVNEYLSVQSYLVDKSKNLNNIEIYGFDNQDSIVNNLWNYRDPIHYHSGINESILRSVVIGVGRLTKKNVKSYIFDVLNKICDYRLMSDFESMVPFAQSEEREFFDNAIKMSVVNDEIERVKVYLAKQEISSAISLLEKLSNLPSLDERSLFEVLILKAEALAKNNNYELGSASYSKAILLQPTNAWLYVKRGQLYEKIEKYALARADYLVFIRMKPNHVQGHWLLGNLEAKSGNFDRAIQCLSDAIYRDPQKANLYRDRARVFAQIGDPVRASTDVELAKKIDSNVTMPKVY